jgi:putative Mn2+ efflux pump MntP
MATVVYVILIAIALALAIFAVIVQRGASIVKLDAKLVGSGLLAGALQLGAAVVGYGIGRWILSADLVRDHSIFWVHVLAGFLLAVIGIRMLLQAFARHTILEHRIDMIDMKYDTILFLRLCLNALVAGISCGLLEVNLLTMLVAVFAAALIFVVLGYLSGRIFGGESSGKAYALGGSLLCLIGICLQVIG